VDKLASLDPTTAVVLIAAVVIMVIVLFAKFIKGTLKLAIITAMLLCILYFLRQAGVL